MEENNQITIYIEKTWVTGDTCVFAITNPFEKAQAKTKIKPFREEFVERLRQEGFKVTFNKADITEDTICLIMDDTALCPEGTPPGEFKKLFDQKVFSSAGENFHYPTSMPISEYFANPFFPAVFKNEMTNGGEDKFLIETPEQLATIKEFYDSHIDNPTYKRAFEGTICQQFLETPGKYDTYMRVLVGGTGEVLGASIKCSTKTMGSPSLNGLFEQVFLNPASKYFIDAKKMFNYYSGGDNITFTQPKYSLVKAEILAELGIDPTHPEVPSEVIDVCENIMAKCNREIGVLCGVDFMFNKHDGKWYYLENQAFPAIEEWAWANNISLPKSRGVEGYIQYLKLELQPRYIALMSLVNKKKNKNQQRLELKQ